MHVRRHCQEKPDASNCLGVDPGDPFDPFDPFDPGDPASLLLEVTFMAVEEPD